MPDIETIKGKVLIDADRYEELIKLEQKVENVAIIIQENGYIARNDLLCILGYKRLSETLEERDGKRYAEYKEKMESDPEENIDYE